MRRVGVSLQDRSGDELRKVVAASRSAKAMA
jgi:hypothetical protein